ncbi:ParB/RepB/Spo0J family partition protein [Aureimonas phyllosphaerae]|uniref:ParB family chromosome partitioning protein n=1 Tax=Aureimonas phyllosphaerae TaxID=1166078 RepID=A0A7W6BWA1_9HYPH|nr:ParB/RepB/Spo0J family partition protein [Aureimonas phyllosphaerae]MBB3936313.1 ParB family chromosome partitioning protein [Aureimonas phyllosphaerae]MBB3959962.1 ParB family chromosome partitioning protein [Aureimonas phyllosphaerae]SFF47960.1 chromosome segregation DNA-binding protein [Aureimonas phyllosphaerae]
MTEDKGRQRLGRGLASLIGGSASSTLPSRAGSAFPGPAMAREAQVGERRVAPSELRPNPKNPRRHFDETELEELTASVRQHGVVQPILVRRVEGAGGFEIVAGERRWRAAKAAALKDVPVVLREISDRQSLEIAIIENVQRADLDPIEEALGYEMLIAEHGYTQADLADVVGKSRSHVANTLRLLKLPDSVKDMVQRGELSAGAARTAVAQDDPEAFAWRIVDEGLSVREAESLARGPDAPQASKPAPRRRTPVAPAAPQASDARALADLLSETLGLPVSIEMAGQGGTLQLTFRDLDQLDTVCRLLQAGERKDGDGGPRIRIL